MTADRITDALDLLARAVETHDGAPADTNLARAQVLATIAVAEQLAKLTQAVAAQHGPPAPATGGQAETAPEKTPAPRLMLGDVWSDDSDDEWTVLGQDGRLLLTWDGETRTWESADSQYGPLTLIERAGYRRTTDTAPINTVTRFRVVSCEEWEDGAPVEIDTVHAVGVTYWVLGEDGRDSITVPAAPDMRVTLWAGQAVAR